MKLVYERNQKIQGSLQKNFDEDYAFLEKALERSGDIVKNMFYAGDGKTRAVVIYVDGMTDAQTVQDFVIRPLQSRFGTDLTQDLGSLSAAERLSYLEKHVLETVDWKEVETYEDILTDILSGNALLLVEGCAGAVSLSTKNFPTRGVGQTEQEMVIRGPKDSFTEGFRTNTALIRRRIRDPRLKMENRAVKSRWYFRWRNGRAAFGKKSMDALPAVSAYGKTG